MQYVRFKNTSLRTIIRCAPLKPISARASLLRIYIYLNAYLCGATFRVLGTPMVCYVDLGCAYRGSALVAMRVIKKFGNIPEAVRRVQINYEIPGATKHSMFINTAVLFSFTG